MGSRNDGFTLIELMIVVAVIAILAAIAVPSLRSAGLRANESAAIATLRSVAGAQAQCHASAAIDVNTNGAGEFGFTAELSGYRGIRQTNGLPSATQFVTPPVLRLQPDIPVTYLGGGITDGGATLRAGYYFGAFLPAASGDFVPEAPGGGATAAHNPDPRACESLWCLYAWPSSLGNTGNRAFFVNQSGEVLSALNSRAATRYEGTSRGPLPEAAFVGPGMASNVAANTVGNDGQRWSAVN